MCWQCDSFDFHSCMEFARTLNYCQCQTYREVSCPIIIIVIIIIIIIEATKHLFVNLRGGAVRARKRTLAMQCHVPRD